MQKHLLAVSAAFLIGLHDLSAQALTSNYTFAQTSQLYTPITTGTVHGTSLNDDQLFSNIPIGFVIAFNGASYNSVGISPNGYIWLGATAPAATNYTPVSSTSGSSAFICALARNLESRSAAGGGELRSALTGTSPNRVFTVQWKNYQRFSSGTSDNGDIFNFQIKLYEYNQKIEIVYGPMTTTLSSTAQVGLRGSANTNFMNRVVNTTYPWNNSAPGTVNTATVSYTSARLPASGQTYRWTPTSLLNSTVSGGDLDTTVNSNPDQVIGNTTATAGVTSEGGINSLGIQRFVNGISQPWVAMTKISGDSISGVFQTSLPPINTVGDVVYLYRVINPQKFFLYTEPVAYEVGYLRTYAPLDILMPVTLQGTGMELQAASSVSAIKITEVVTDRSAAGGNPSVPSYTPTGNYGLIELTNLSNENVKMDGITIRINNSSASQEYTFPDGIILSSGARVTVRTGGTAGQLPTGINDEIYFETGGTFVAFSSEEPAGVALFNEHQDVLDAVAWNGYTFPSGSGVRMVHFYGPSPSVSGKAGIRRTTMTDHNSSVDWETTDSSSPSGIGSMNPGLSASLSAPQFTWSCDQLPGWSASGAEIALPVLSHGNYNVKVRCTDNGFYADDSVNITIYSPAPPSAAFAASALQVYPDMLVSFTDQSTNYPDTYLWSITPGTYTFTNGTGASSANPQVKFTTPGSYSVTLTVTNEEGAGILTKTDYITVDPFLGICVYPAGVQVGNITSTAVEVSWNEGYEADSMQVRYAPAQGNVAPKQVYTVSTSAQLTGLNTGTTYFVRVRPWCNGSASDGYSPKVYFTTSGLRLFDSFETPSNPEILVFPNPAHDHFNIRLIGFGGPVDIRLTDLSGRIVHSMYGITSEQFTISPKNVLTPGLYLLHVKSPDNESTSKVFITE